MKMVKASLCLIIAFAVVSCAFAGRVLDEHFVAAPPVEAPLPVDPLPVPTEPPVDPVVVPAVVPAASLPLPSNAAGAVPAGGATANVEAGTGTGADDRPLTFFMHDILGGGSRPSALMVTGVVAIAADLANGNSVLGGTSGNLVPNNDNNNIPSVNAGDLPSASGATPQNLLFGTTTIIDEDLTESHELGAAVVGTAQGFHVASSRDGASRTVVLTAMFGGGQVHGDTLSFIGVHRMEAPASHVTIIGGTGKYQNVKGFAAIQTLQPGDQQITEGGKNLLQFNVHLS